ncbi:uncharacterized protein EI90DRAFT_3070138 [Cantharellus anzutake]|uniref:uncharacterized protein n=1 Tax=Cantharellus anzutake TaxID=1750568 RepID=UPI0019068F8E|nr:uncharacterized protein EI90DRAFT_3070138 [Cantharellus anzutake]KAF8326678.1 hypothetical protein EI90DRAFT_3070138 [Cantharellus anzutake]
MQMSDNVPFDPLQALMNARRRVLPTHPLPSLIVKVEEPGYVASDPFHRLVLEGLVKDIELITDEAVESAP